MTFNTRKAFWTPTRRKLLTTGAALAATSIAAPSFAQGRRIKIGYVTPKTGPLSAFSESDDFVIARFNAATNNQFEVIVKDCQSNPNRAAEVAKDLIIEDEIDLMLVGHTPEVVNPVAVQCENEEVPCISTLAPWQPIFIGQQSNPTDPSSWAPLNYNYHFFWGLEDIIGVFTNMWDALDTNRNVGGLFPNDADGNAWGDPNLGLPPALAAQGFNLTDPGRYQNLSDDFSAQINAFKAAETDIVTGVVLPPDFTTFWSQARQQGFVPKAASIAKAILFPSSVATLGDLGQNLSSEVWWSPTHPFSSSLTGETAAQLAGAFEDETSRQWTQPIGFVHALFELAADVMSRVSNPSDSDEVVSAIKATQANTVVGRVAWDGTGLPEFAQQNVAKTPLVGGQWRQSGDATTRYDLVITSNATAPNIPAAGTMEAITA